MAATEKPKSRLPDGRINPEYTAWRKANRSAVPAFDAEPKEEEPAPEILDLLVRKLPPNQNFVTCIRDDEPVHVRIRKGNGPKLLGKMIRVRIDADGTYHHER